jgi:hypothetical protein
MVLVSAIGMIATSRIAVFLDSGDPCRFTTRSYDIAYFGN